MTPIKWQNLPRISDKDLDNAIWLAENGLKNWPADEPHINEVKAALEKLTAERVRRQKGRFLNDVSAILRGQS